MIGFASWVGALCMMLAPFIIDTTAGKMLAIVGLFMLTLQAIKGKLWNLVALNLTGIIGYCYAIYF